MGLLIKPRLVISKVFKRNTILQFLSLLDANFANRKAFEGLVILVKNSPNLVED